MIKMIMLATGVFWLLCLFVIPVYRIEVPEPVQQNWMMLNPSGEFPVIQTIFFLAGDRQPMVEIQGVVLLSAFLAILFIIMNGVILLNRAITFLQSPASRFSPFGFLLVAISLILQSGFLLWFFSSLNRHGISTVLTRNGWVACGISVAILFIMYPLKRSRTLQTKPDDKQAQHDTEA